MNERWIGIAILAAALAAGCPGPAPEEAEAPADEVVPVEAVEVDMVEWERLSTPGEHHRHLGAIVGDWHTTTRFWPAPGEPPEVVRGTLQSEWVFGGRYVRSRHSSAFMGVPYEAELIEGYDNGAERYTGVWLDNLSTFMIRFSGTCSDDGKLRVMRAEYDDPMTGEKTATRAVTTVVDENNFTYEVFLTGPEGSEFRNMEIVATRK